MIKIFGILILSFVFTGLLSVPFINLLYKIKFQRQDEKNQKDALGKDTPIFARLHGWKVGTPNGGGILVIISVLLFSYIFYNLTKFEINWTGATLFITIILFGILGFYDDIQKIFGWKKNGFWGLRIRYKLLLQILFGLIVSALIYFKVGISSMLMPFPYFDFFGGDSSVWHGIVINLGAWYILFSTFIIVVTTNAFNITDGLDGLATGLLIIALCAFWFLAGLGNWGDIILFIGVLTGSLLAFLYFNIYPARIWMGDTGALAFGALLAVISLISQSVMVLPIIGGVFMVEALSTLIQWSSKAFRHKKVFLCAPIHHHFEAKGWDETKVTMRFWLAGAILAFFGLFIALLPTLKF
jgi:phospho-N-acetylmuramoyl-pentapeptide-transferase